MVKRQMVRICCHCSLGHRESLCSPLQPTWSPQHWSSARRTLRCAWQVVLRTDVVGLGKTGELTKVPNGYYRNWLLPQGLAAPATEGILACGSPPLADGLHACGGRCLQLYRERATQRLAAQRAAAPSERETLCALTLHMPACVVAALMHCQARESVVLRATNLHRAGQGAEWSV